jgi:pimeloyl-ACP methyl ester carboxylesterase
MTSGVRSQFVQVGERRVFLRYAGTGPVLVLLHQSPESSASLVPWIERLADRYAVLAPDTPGFGHSDPLPLAQPTIPDLAAALGRLLEALGLGPVLLWGVHTGAAIACRLARDEPGRVAALVCDGLSAFTREERQPLLDGYLPPFEPSWDGGHLHWLWARIREQTLFFPWHSGTAAARIAYPLASPERIHAQVMELLDAGDGYRAGYRAPLLYEHGAASAAELAVPAALLYRAADVLRPHLERLPPLPPGVTAREVADAAAQAREAEAMFARHAQAASPLESLAMRVDAKAAIGRRVVLGPGGARVWHLAGPEQAPDPTLDLVLPEIGTPAWVPADRSPRRRTLVPEWPGHGASARSDAALLSDGRWCVGLMAEMDALTAAPDAPVALRARGGACALALELALALGPRCRSLALEDPLPLDAEERATFLAGLPDLTLHPTGAHLIAAWNWARLRQLFWPWCRPDAAACIAAPAPPPRAVHAEVVEMLRAGPMLAALWRAALAVHMPAAVAALRKRGVAVTLRAGAEPERQRLLARLGAAD